MTTDSKMTAAEKLFGARGFPLISIYLPTHKAGAEIWQDPIRFKNLLRSAEHDLEAGGVSRKRIEHLLAPLVERRDDRDFWQHQGEGLALFRWPDGLEEFRLSMPVQELCVVAERFHVKPLLLSLANQQSYYILALSKSQVRLFRASPSGLSEVHGLPFPEGLDQKADGREKALQSHSGGHGTQIPHGHEPDRKAEFAAYCRRIDHAVSGAIDARDLVILAAVDYVGAIFSEFSTLRALSPSIIAGCPDTTSEDQLLKRSAPIAEHYFHHRREVTAARFLRSVAKGLTLDHAEAVIDAARQGRIETLLVAVGVQVWADVGADGSLDLSDTRRPLDEDILNLALIETWRSGGRVEALPPEDMPGGLTVAAITRF